MALLQDVANVASHFASCSMGRPPKDQARLQKTSAPGAEVFLPHSSGPAHMLSPNGFFPPISLPMQASSEAFAASGEMSAEPFEPLHFQQPFNVTLPSASNSASIAISTSAQSTSAVHSITPCPSIDTLDSGLLTYTRLSVGTPPEITTAVAISSSPQPEATSMFACPSPLPPLDVESYSPPDTGETTFCQPVTNFSSPFPAISSVDLTPHASSTTSASPALTALMRPASQHVGPDGKSMDFATFCQLRGQHVPQTGTDFPLFPQQSWDLVTIQLFSDYSTTSYPLLPRVYPEGIQRCIDNLAAAATCWSVSQISNGEQIGQLANAFLIHLLQQPDRAAPPCGSRLWSDLGSMAREHAPETFAFSRCFPLQQSVEMATHQALKREIPMAVIRRGGLFGNPDTPENKAIEDALCADSRVPFASLSVSY